MHARTYIISVATAKHMHRSLTVALVKSSLRISADKQLALLDLMGINMSEAMVNFPHHLQVCTCMCLLT